MIRRYEPSLIGEVKCERVELASPLSKPFFLGCLAKLEARQLLGYLEDLGRRPGRFWYDLVSGRPDPKRLRLVRLLRTPEYELAAETNYLRGDIFRINGKQNSCHINFSGPIGARLLAEQLRSALERTRNTIDIVVPNRHRKKDLVEFIADADREANPSDEHNRLAQAGEVMAAELLPAEDFSDWD